MNQEALRTLEKKLKKIKIEGFIIQQSGNRIFEYLRNKKVKEKPGKIYSVTKSIISILIGILVDKGLIDDIHTPIHKYFPEILNSADPQIGDITLFHLLTMTSGFKVSLFESSKNWIRYLLEQPVIHTPGTTFQYNSGGSHLLSAIINKVSGKTTAEFAEENLFGPLKIKEYIWIKDPQGIHRGGFGLSISIEDMMKIGTLLLQSGKFGAKQLVSGNWILESQRPNKIVELGKSGEYGYGYQFWTYEGSINEKSLNYFYAKGLFGQFIFVVPELNIVAVAKSQLQREDEKPMPKQYFEDFLANFEKTTPEIINS